MSKGSGGGTLGLGLATETITNWTPWGGESDGKERPGAEFGCDLVRSADGKIHVVSRQQAALCMLRMRDSDAPIACT